MPPVDNTALKETADEFTRAVSGLESLKSLAVVRASPVTKRQVHDMLKRAVAVRRAIESTGRAIDGARRWFTDTFGASVEDSVPLANPAIGASVQTSIAAMKYFIKDAAELYLRVMERHKRFEAFPKEKQTQVLAELAAQTDAAPVAAKPVNKWVVIGAVALGAFVLWKGSADHGE